jgi:hypothetical protein
MILSKKIITGGMLIAFFVNIKPLFTPKTQNNQSLSSTPPPQPSEPSKDVLMDIGWVSAGEYDGYSWVTPSNKELSSKLYMDPYVYNTTYRSMTSYVAEFIRLDGTVVISFKADRDGNFLEDPIGSRTFSNEPLSSID